MLSVLTVARGSPAVFICFELRVSWVVMGISTGVHIHLCARVRYAHVQYLYGAWAWAAYSLLDRVYGQS